MSQLDGELVGAAEQPCVSEVAGGLSADRVPGVLALPSGAPGRVLDGASSPLVAGGALFVCV